MTRLLGQKNNGTATEPCEGNPLSGYIVKRQRRILGDLLRGNWGASLLEINSWPGTFLSFYRELGLDVSVCETSPERRAQLLGNGGESLKIYAAAAEHLPLPDDFFDWVIYHADGDEMEKSLAECWRVCRRGLLLAFWNSCSLAAALWKMGCRSQIVPYRTCAATRVLRMARSLEAAGIFCLSGLFGPPASWHDKSFFSFMNALPLRGLLGAWCVIRVDAGQQGLATPLGLRVEAGMGKPLAALEFSQKNFRNCQKDMTDS